MVYAEVGNENYEIVGAFSGICGGGGLFYINQNGEVNVSDDCLEFETSFQPNDVETIYSTLKNKRAEYLDIKKY